MIYLTISSLSDAEFTTGHQRPFQTDCSIIQTRGTHLNPMIMRKIVPVTKHNQTDSTFREVVLGSEDTRGNMVWELKLSTTGFVLALKKTINQNTVSNKCSLLIGKYFSTKFVPESFMFVNPSLFPGFGLDGEYYILARVIVFDLFCLMVLNATFNNISVISQ